jgi:hypothetical protein
MQDTPFDVRMTFEEWAGPLGYDLCSDSDGFLNLETRHAWLGFESAHGPSGCRPEGQQLYAHIKRTSDYAHQTDKLFPVRVGKAPYNDYVVHGGPGGLYRMSDVSFYVVEDDKQYRLD